MNKIQRVSTFFRIFFQFIFVALPISTAVSWIYAPDPLILLAGVVQFDPIPHSYKQAILHTLTVSDKLSAFTLDSIPLAIELFILYSLIKLFKLYERGEIFSLNNVGYIRRIAYALLAGQIINPIYEGLMGVVLTWNNPHGHRLAAITFDQTNVGILLMAGLVILISWIMTEGCNLHEEQQLTI